MEALAIIPLLDKTEKAVGTILVERNDQRPLSKEEVEDFLDFGRQLAIVIEQGERVNLLQSTLDRVPSPLVIATPSGTVRYANRAATDLLSVPAGWHVGPDAPKLPDLGPLRPVLDEALDGRTSYRQFHSLPRSKDYHCAALFEPISDWRGQTGGAFVYIEDLNESYRVLQTFEGAAEAHDPANLLRVLLDGMKVFGHKWGRLYLITGEGPAARLVSKLSFGFADKGEEQRFASGGYILSPDRSPGEESWISLRCHTPVLLVRGDQDGPLLNRHGIQMFGVSRPRCPGALTKKTGECWLDFPLLADREPYGKITLGVDEDITPRHMEFFSVLCGMVSRLLGAFLRRERTSERERALIRVDVANRSLAALSHNLATRFAGLDAFVGRYRRREPQVLDLKSVNDEFADAYREILAVLSEAKHKLREIRIEPKEVDAAQFMQAAFSRLLPQDAFTVHHPPNKVMAWLDESFLGAAIAELVQNARDVAPDISRLRLRVSFESIHQGGRQYVRFIVEDNGPGVETQYKTRLFEDFFTHHPGGEPGTGLGLAHVRRIVEAHEGEVRENGQYRGRSEGFGELSDLRWGARFELDIPNPADITAH